MAETPRAGTGDSACRSWRYRCSIVLIRQGNLSMTGTFFTRSLPRLDNMTNLHWLMLLLLLRKKKSSSFHGSSMCSKPVFLDSWISVFPDIFFFFFPYLGVCKAFVSDKSFSSASFHQDPVSGCDIPLSGKKSRTQIYISAHRTSSKATRLFLAK